jgi:hypothetical protein
MLSLHALPFRVAENWSRLPPSRGNNSTTVFEAETPLFKFSMVILRTGFCFTVSHFAELTEFVNVCFIESMSNEKLLAYGVKMGLVSYAPIRVNMRSKTTLATAYARGYRKRNRQKVNAWHRDSYARTKNPRVNKHTGINIDQSTKYGKRAYMREYMRRLRADA